MKKRLPFLITLLLCTACTSPLTSPNPDKRLPVTTSFYPLYEFTQQVGKENVIVTNLTPPGSEPHDFDPKPQDIAKLEHSKLFIYNGAGLEKWVDKIKPDLQKNNTTIVEAMQNIQTISNSNTTSQTNPHLWLDPILAQQEVENIKTGLQKADPQNALLYETNATEYKAQLDELDAEIQQGLATCKKSDIITSHDAFAYYARRYKISVHAIAGLSPDEEPSPKQLAQIVKVAREKNITYIFFESLASPKLSDTIAKEVGAKTLVLNPIEGLTEGEISQGKNYISVQIENLNNLKIALECE
jgi:zinc transport system substrate-binding protein